jgi:Animal haem peroxidase
LGHYYINQNLKLVDRANNVRDILMSDTFGKFEILEDNFDDILRGALSQRMNDGQYTDEMINKFAKNGDGVGVDVVSIDIQRGKLKN